MKFILLVQIFRVIERGGWQEGGVVYWVWTGEQLRQEGFMVLLSGLLHSAYLFGTPLEGAFLPGTPPLRSGVPGYA